VQVVPCVGVEFKVHDELKENCDHKNLLSRKTSKTIV